MVWGLFRSHTDEMRIYNSHNLKTEQGRERLHRITPCAGRCRSDLQPRGGSAPPFLSSRLHWRHRRLRPPSVTTDKDTDAESYSSLFKLGNTCYLQAAEPGVAMPPSAMHELGTCLKGGCVCSWAHVCASGSSLSGQPRPCLGEEVNEDCSGFPGRTELSSPKTNAPGSLPCTPTPLFSVCLWGPCTWSAAC